MNPTQKKIFTAERHLRINSAGNGEPDDAFGDSGRGDPGGAAWLVNTGERSELISAIAELRGELLQCGSKTISEERKSRILAITEELDEARFLKNEIKNLAEAIDTTKREIAALRYKALNFERIADVSSELDEVVADTERATNTILSSCEQIERLAGAIQNQENAGATGHGLEAMGDIIFQIYEACNFQDITGQRIGRVVSALKYIEARVDAMMHIWGGKEVFASIPLPEAEAKTEDEMLLNGPARANDDIASQADIDSLFD